MNFPPFGAHFSAVHQFTKFSSEQIQTGAMLLTSSSDGTIQYIRPEPSGSSFLSANGSVQSIPVTVPGNIPRVGNQQLPQPPSSGSQQITILNQSSTKYHSAGAATILSWGDVPTTMVHHHFNDKNGSIATINVPFHPAGPGVHPVPGGATVLAVQPTVAPGGMWPVKVMHNAATMTVESELQSQGSNKPEISSKDKPKEKMESLSVPNHLIDTNVKSELKDSGGETDDDDDEEGDDDDDESEEDSKSNVGDKKSVTNPMDFVECHQIQLQQQGSAMADYLARLPQSVPLGLQHFLKYQNGGEDAGGGILPGGAVVVPKREVEKKSNAFKKGRPGEIRLSTALDGSTLFCCPECHMAYPERSMLDQHMSGHRLERRFVCNVCGAGLKRKEHLDQHKRGHSNERPFVCSLCLKGFKRNEHLTRHYVIHSGEKGHCCSECGKRFSRKDHLHKHAQTHIARRVKAELTQVAENVGIGEVRSHALS